MKPTLLHVLPLLGLAAALSAPPAAALPSRTEGLRQAFAEAGAKRNVYFVRGMNCRACTIILDRNLSGMDGVYWARFSYPVRLLTVYHDPDRITASRIEELIGSTGKLTLVPLERGPAGEHAPARGVPAASWEGGSLSLDEARALRARFLAVLEAYMIEPGTNEWHQVGFEIAAEEVRNRILLLRARKEGYAPQSPGGELPVFIAKEFYWPLELMPLTPEEGAVARFVRERVIGGDESEKGLEKFDDWLLALWQEVALDYRGELMELED